MSSMPRKERERIDDRADDGPPAAAVVPTFEPLALMPSGLIGDNTSTIFVTKEGKRSERGIP